MRGAAILLAALLAAAPAQGRVLCTLLADAASGHVLHQSGDGCAIRVPPASTFKIALALMAADSGLITGPHAPVLPYRPGYPDYLPSWRHDTDPTAWMGNSVVWYSQRLTERLGMERFAAYVAGFDYGNRDLSGNPGKNDGLTRAWLSASLEISAAEQAGFLRRLLARQLPVSDQAVALAATLTGMEGGPAGWRLHGKTGTGAPPKANGDGRDWDRAYGWFVGWLQQDGRALVFVRLNQDEEAQPVSAGFRARDAMLADLPALLERSAP